MAQLGQVGPYREAAHAPGPPPVSAAVALCSTCGIVAPAQATTCAVCKKPFEAPRRTMSTGGMFWVALRCTFPCRACGFPSPLEGIELDAGVHCAQCGSLQRFDKGGWGKALGFAHEIGDLAGPKPEGRFPHPRVWIGSDNPHRAIGDTRTFGEIDAGSLHVEAAPGYPFCAKCRAPYEIQLDGAGASAHCRGCGDRARYELAPEGRGYESALRAVVSTEQCVDRKRVRVQETQGGLVALSCPQCGAGMRPSDGAVVECAYCHTTALLPARARSRALGGTVEPPIFWVLFEGPSRRRAALETPVPPKAAGALKKAAGVLKRGLAPLPGIELAPLRPGLDVRQLGLTALLTVLAIAIGAAFVIADKLM